MYRSCSGAALKLSQIHNKDHLLALSKVSRSIRCLVFPRLFEVLTIQADVEYGFWEIETYPSLNRSFMSGVPNVLAAVKDLRLCEPSGPLREHEMDNSEHSGDMDADRSSIESSSIEDIQWTPKEDGDNVAIKADNNVVNERKSEQDDACSGVKKLEKRIARLLSIFKANQLTSFRYLSCR